MSKHQMTGSPGSIFWHWPCSAAAFPDQWSWFWLSSQGQGFKNFISSSIMLRSISQSVCLCLSQSNICRAFQVEPLSAPRYGQASCLSCMYFKCQGQTLQLICRVFGAMTLSIMALCIVAFRITIHSVVTISITINKMQQSA